MLVLSIATAIQFVILLGLVVVVLSLARQVGILHERLSPAGLAQQRESIQPGDRFPETTLDAIGGETVTLGASGNPTACLFVTADCPICKSVLPAFTAWLAEAGSHIEAVWIADGMPGNDGQIPDYAQYADAQSIDPARLLISQELGMKLGVRQIPALAVINDSGVLQVLETVNGPRQLQRLLDAHAATPSGENSA